MYNPQLQEKLIRALYQLKLKEKRTMVALANEAVEEYLFKKGMLLMEENHDDRR